MSCADRPKKEKQIRWYNHLRYLVDKYVKEYDHENRGDRAYKKIYDFTKEDREKAKTEAKIEVLEEVEKEMQQIIDRWELILTSPIYAPMYGKASQVLQEFKSAYLRLKKKKNL